MAIRRGKVPADEFTIISNAMLRDPRLTWKAKGLLAYVMSHAADYSLSTEQIIAEGKDSRDAVRAGLRELEEVGVLRRLPLRDEHGRTAGFDYEVTAPTDGWSGDGKPVPGADQQEEDVSAGETSDGKSGAGESATKKNTSKKTNQKTTKPPASAGAEATEGRGTSEEQEPKPASGGSVVADWIDYCASQHVTLTKQAIGRYGAKIKDLLGQGFDERTVKKALALMLERHQESRPGLLDNVIIEIQRAGRPVSAPPAGRQEFKTAAEKRRERDAHYAQRYAIADKLCEQEGTEIPRLGTPEAKTFWARVDGIHETLLRDRRGSGYNDPDVIVAEVIEGPVPEVTA